MNSIIIIIIAYIIIMSITLIQRNCWRAIYQHMLNVKRVIFEFCALIQEKASDAYDCLDVTVELLQCIS